MTSANDASQASTTTSAGTAASTGGSATGTLREPQPHSYDELVERARALARSGQRKVLGIVGSPGAGKTTLARALASTLGEQTVLVPMDGYHFANDVLDALDRRGRKGAPDTFDVAGYVSLLDRIIARGEAVVYAPEFDRDSDQPIGSAIPIGPEVPLIITEGNYLLHDENGWQEVRSRLDEVWFVDPGEDVRREQLIDRHTRFGRSPEAARDWALGSDERNARIITETRERADLVLCVDKVPVIL